MIRVNFFATYSTNKRFCEQLQQAAQKKPAFGKDPLLQFTNCVLQGTIIEAGHCARVADRLEQLAHGELARPASFLAQRLRAAANAEVPFCMR